VLRRILRERGRAEKGAATSQPTLAVYRLDGAETTVPGPIGWDTRAKAAYQNGAFVVSIKRTIQGPDGPINFEIRDVYTLSGTALTLERSQGSRSVKMVYHRP
jgi:hypothetical protein